MTLSTIPVLPPRSKWLVGVLALLLWALLPLRAAHALSEGQVLFVAPASDASAEELALARATIASWLSQRGRSLAVLEDEACDLRCASERLADKRGAMAMQLELWSERDFRPTGTVAIKLRDARGGSSGTAELRGGTDEALVAGVRAALEHAFAAWSARGGQLVRIEGTPAGASFIIDRDPELGGTAPADVRLAPGPHVVSLSNYGYDTSEHAFVVPAEASKVIPLRFSLEPNQRDRLAREQPGLDWVEIAVPTAIGAAGVAAIVLGAIGLSRADECLERAPTGACIRRRETRESASWALMGAGSGLVLGALGYGVWAIVDQRHEGASAGITISWPARPSKQRF